MTRLALRPPGRVLLVHYWLVGMRGGERVLESFCRMFPDADILTHVVEPTKISDTLAAHRIRTTFIQSLPFARRRYQSYLPLMPGALEAEDLRGYDLVVSSEAGPAKGVIPPPDASHLCYCHSPMRYLWDQFAVYRAEAGPLARLAMPLLSPGLRRWDVITAARVDRFVANSPHVADRIRAYWRRGARVVHPPVAVDDFRPVSAQERGDFYLWAGELAPYKRPDIAIDVFRRLGRPFVMIGGPAKTAKALARRAGPRTRVLGPTSFDTLRDHLARCRALIFPGEEDFGIVPVEAMASGRPVIAYGRGGALETVRQGETGVLYEDPSAEGLAAAIERFEASGLEHRDPHAIAAHARRFAEPRFQVEMAREFRSLGVEVPLPSETIEAARAALAP